MLCFQINIYKKLKIVGIEKILGIQKKFQQISKTLINLVKEETKSKPLNSKMLKNSLDNNILKHISVSMFHKIKTKVHR